MKNSKIKFLLCLVIATLMVSVMVIGASAAEVTALSGSGTEADPYVIANADDLIFFRDSVNAGETTYNATGVYVQLANNIDLKGIDWSVNIGDDAGATFDGIFDGNNKTIYNLESVETAQKSDGYICTGLFGAIYGSAVIKDLTIENVSIDTGAFTGNNVSAVVGFIWQGTGSIENVTVCGDIKINATGAYAVGAIAGYSFYDNGLEITGCKVVAEDGSYINAKSGIGGIIGYTNGDVITNCEVSGLDMSATAIVGGISGTTLNTTIDNVKISNASLAVSLENWVNSNAIAVGCIADNKVKVTNVAYENVAGATSVVGSEYVEKPTAPVKGFEASVNGVYYMNFADALAANGVVVLNRDVEIDADNTIMIAKGKELTLDLNGFTLTGVSDVTGSNRNMFDVRGTLTVKNGTINYEHKGANMGWNSSTNVFNVTAGGVLNIDGATVANLGGSDMAFVAHLNNWGEVTLNVTNSTLKATYVAVRVFNSGYDMNNVTIKNSTLEGAKYAFWVHNFTAADFGANYDAATVEGRLNFDLSGNEYVCSVAPFRLGMTNSVVMDANGNYFVASDWAIDYAINAADDGATITVTGDIALAAQNIQELMKPVYNRESYAGLVIPDDKAIVLDLNGHTISYVDTYGNIDNVMILNLGILTINDSVGDGKITYKPVWDTSKYSKFYSTIFNCGTLIVNAGTIENTCETETDVTDAVDNHSRLSHEYGNDSILIVNGGTLSGAYYYAIRQYTHYLEGVQNRVIINDGTIKGGIYMQHGESWYYADPAKNRLNVDFKLTINGGVIDVNETPDKFGKVKAYLNNPDNNAFDIEINGGTVNVPVQLLIQRGVFYTNGVSGATTPAETAGARTAEWLAAKGGIVTGGTFVSLDQAYVADGYIYKDGVVRETLENEALAKDEDALKDALADESKTEILVGGDVTLDETLIVPEGTNVNLDGNTITGDVVLGGDATIGGGAIVGNVTIEADGVVIDGATIDGDVVIDSANGVTIKNGTINGGIVIGSASGVQAVSYVIGTATANVIVIENQTINVDGAGKYAITIAQADTTVVLKNCTVNLANGAELYKSEADNTALEIRGGVMPADPTAYLAKGYQANKVNDTLYIITAVPFIGENGNWFIGDEDTGVKAQGDKGDQGDQGETGATGPQGPQGETGAAGKDAVTPQFKIGDDNYWYVSVDNGATWQKLDAKATGDKGDQGETGATGPQGPQGDQGETGAAGVDGVTPKLRINATTNEWEYSIAQDGEGQDVWVSLGIKATGEKGDQGEVGPQGPQGDKGETGAPGADGIDGEKGDKGDKGDEGDPADTKVLKIACITFAAIALIAIIFAIAAFKKAADVDIVRFYRWK